MIYIGIDVAKNKHDCCIIGSGGVIINDSLYAQYFIFLKIIPHLFHKYNSIF